MELQTTRFGSLLYSERDIITFADGLAGIGPRRFVVVRHADRGGFGSPLLWLQAVDDGGLAFLAIDPVCISPGYRASVSAEALSGLGLEPQSLGRSHVLALVTMPDRDVATATANLAAPIVLNPLTGLATQVVLDDEAYVVRQPLLPRNS